MAQDKNVLKIRRPPKFLPGSGQACLPPAVVDPIQWLESTRWLSPESSREIGPFRFDRAPYLIEPQKAIIDSDTTEIVLDWRSQAGKSEIILNSLLFWSVHSAGADVAGRAGLEILQKSQC